MTQNSGYTGAIRAMLTGADVAVDERRPMDPMCQQAAQWGQAADIRGMARGALQGAASGIPAVRGARAVAGELRAAHQAEQSYTVRPGDTLSAIAARLLGRAERWPEIAALNGITDPRSLQVGAELKLPMVAAPTPATPDTAGPQTPPLDPTVQPPAPGPGPVGPDDPLAVPRGQLTFDAEGNDDPASRYYTRRLHHPSPGSGVTLGRGYDMSQRSAEQIRRELTLAELDPAVIGRLVGAAGLTGKPASSFCQTHADIEVTHEQQKALFAVAFGEKEYYAAACLRRWSNIALDELDPVVRDIVVDLFYRGDVTHTKWDQNGMAAAMTDTGRLRALLANRALWGNIDTNRYQSRLDYLDRPAIPGEAPETDAADDPPPPAVIGHGVVTAGTLNVRREPNATGNTPIGQLHAGEAVEVLTRRGEWLQIRHGGGAAWVHGGFVDVDGAGPPGGGSQGATGTGSGAETSVPTGSDLKTLMAQPRLTPEQIAEARVLVEHEPEAARPGLFEQLQQKVPYHSQRDNKSSRAGANIGNMCNLTTLAMCLEYLGIANPGTLDGAAHPQFEDYLEALRIKDGLGPRTHSETMKQLARRMGASSWQAIAVGKDDHAAWVTRRDTYLRAGKAILLSIGGHIVRVQEVTEGGLVVDDPYGQVKLTPGAPGTSGNYHWKAENAEHAADDKGEDNVWAWDEVKTHGMKWAVAIGL